MAVESLDKWVSCIYRHGQIFMNRELEKHGIGSGQHAFICTICEQPGISQDKIAQILVMNKGTVARATKQLEDEGFLTRQADDKDKRANRVYPTQKAQDIQAIISGCISAWDAQVTTNMNASEKMLLKSLMRKASDNAIVAVKPSYAKNMRKSRFNLHKTEE